MSIFIRCCVPLYTCQNTLTKTLKSLESRHLIKTAKSVTSKSKKLYMLYELSECGVARKERAEPAAGVSGHPPSAHDMAIIAFPKIRRLGSVGRLAVSHVEQDQSITAVQPCTMSILLQHVECSLLRVFSSVNRAFILPLLLYQHRQLFIEGTPDVAAVGVVPVALGATFDNIGEATKKR